LLQLILEGVPFDWDRRYHTEPALRDRGDYRLEYFGELGFVSTSGGGAETNFVDISAEL
jgi:hypothetical protein